MTARVTHHVFIPDTQCKPGVPLLHMRWAGQWIADHFGGSKNIIRLIAAGDGADMESLSSYDRGTGKMEGRRYLKDIAAADEGWSLFEEGLHYRKDIGSWEPDSKDFTLGNHEYRIQRAVDQDTTTLEGVIGYHDLPYAKLGWTVHDFLSIIKRDGVMYSHYFQQAGTGRPIGGENIKLRIRKIGGSFTQGHQQTFDHGVLFTHDGRQLNGLVAGAFYFHDEDYLGQGNAHWRGIVTCHDVRDGRYDIMPISLEYLCRRYENRTLAQLKWRKR